LREVIEHYLLDHEKAMMSAIAGALAIPSVKDPATASPGAPFGVDIARALRYVLDITNWMGFSSENVEGVVGDAVAEVHREHHGVHGMIGLRVRIGVLLHHNSLSKRWRR
jgi:hypothetical protein